MKLAKEGCVWMQRFILRWLNQKTSWRNKPKINMNNRRTTSQRIEILSLKNKHFVIKYYIILVGCALTSTEILRSQWIKKKQHQIQATCSSNITKYPAYAFYYISQLIRYDTPELALRMVILNTEGGYSLQSFLIKVHVLAMLAKLKIFFKFNDRYNDLLQYYNNPLSQFVCDLVLNGFDLTGYNLLYFWFHNRCVPTSV